MTTIDPKKAFLHVINDHRWLAASGCAWNLVGANASNETKEAAHRLLPNIDVAILDSLLLHARSRVDFYRDAQPRPDDITLRNFNLSLDQSLVDDLANFKKPIEVHLLHLTNSRDYDYRTHPSTGSAPTIDRPDWNSESTKIVELILERALRNVSEQRNTGWPLAFKALLEAARERYQNKLSIWPTNLGEKPDVDQFLENLGL